FSGLGADLALLSFPTRRSSDLRIDAEPAWSPDSKTLALFSDAGEKDQKQLWTLNADGSNPKKLTHVKGYAARPRWSHDGRRIARSEEHTSELQSRFDLVCRLLL